MSSSGTMQLRAHQVAALNAVSRALDAGAKALSLHMAAGTGKSTIAAHLVRDLILFRDVKRVLYLVEGRVLQSQMLDAFRRAEMPDGEPLPSVIRVDQGTRQHLTSVVHVAATTHIRAVNIANPSYDAIILDGIKAPVGFLEGFKGIVIAFISA